MEENDRRAAMISVEMNSLRDYTRSETDLITTLDRLRSLAVTGVQLRLLPYIDDRRLSYELAMRGIYADSVFVALEDIIRYPAGAAALADTFGIDMVRTDGMPAEYARSEEGIKSYAARRIGIYNYVIACDRPVTSPIGDITASLSNLTGFLASEE